MPLYITTSRNPSEESLLLCRNLANTIPGSTCERRGGKSVEKLAARARLLGKTRIAVITESGGKPSELGFIAVSQEGWDWLPARIAIRKYSFVKTGEMPEEVELRGSHAELWRGLLDPREREEGKGVLIDCSRKALRFSVGGKKVGEMEVDVVGGDI